MKRRIGYLGAAIALFIINACGPTTIRWDDGTYTGDVSNGRPEGYGTYTADSGHISYEGEWKAGHPDGYGSYARNDSCYDGQLRQGRREGIGRLRTPAGTYEGNWHNDRREGQGIWTDSTGCRLSGIWRNDSLPTGLREDSTGTYSGSLSPEGKPEGYGTFTARTDEDYYDGHWVAGRREGFGLGLKEGRPIQCGEWRANRFHGERMRYTADRVYGIDISRYQHEQGRKVYGISWRKMRIRHLSEAHNRNVVGRADYPVTFCYIKSTQGVRIRSRYYAADSRAARAAGIHVGAYHFMSTAPGSAQAQHFFRHTPIRVGDLPPMLDVELTERQIAQMGGRDAMFREMLAWLTRVEARTGTRPVLYVGQSFVNRHLVHAPEALLKYDVWIARYGEFKPYVHLLYWQLSPYGRVNGIRGDVDINVYNGSKEQFRQYVREHGVKRRP